MPDSANDQLFLGRQPILDRQQQLVAYELLFRSCTRNAAQITDGARATATVIANTFAELSVGDALGPYRGFINVDEDFLFSDLIELLPAQSVVLEILETVPITPEVIARCQLLRQKGFTLALDDIVQLGPEYSALLDLVDIVKIDLQPLAAGEIAQLARQGRAAGLKLLAEKVDSQEQFQRCHDLGFDLFQGYYFARPVILAGRKLTHSQLGLMKLMNLVLTDADTVELEAAFKTEPALTLNLLRLTNSVANGLPVHITSLRHAITVLGRRQLQRWLQLLLFTVGQANIVSPLLQLAATRGRLMELLASACWPKDTPLQDQAFLTGVLSLTPALLGQPIADILAPLSVPAPVHAGLTSHTGTLGDLLLLCEDVERNDPPAALDVIARLPALTPSRASACHAHALGWANNIARAT